MRFGTFFAASNARKPFRTIAGDLGNLDFRRLSPETAYFRRFSSVLIDFHLFSLSFDVFVGQTRV